MTDVDDDRLGALFRAASESEAPPSGFDHSSVVTASRRVTARRRAAVTGVGLALLVVAGVGTVVAMPYGADGGSGETSVAAPMLAPAPAGAPGSAPGGDSRARDEAAQEAAPYAAVPPLGPGTGECADRQDPALRALVEQVLPEVVGAPEAATTQECRPGGERGVNVEVSDGTATGLLTVEYMPPGTVAQLFEGALSAPTASGGTVIVSSRAESPGAPAPLADRLPDAVAHLAPRL